MKQFLPLTTNTQRKIAIATLVAVALSLIASLVAIFAGTVLFENPMPKNFLEYDGWLGLICGACGIGLGGLGLVYGVQQFFNEDVVEVTKDKYGNVIDENRGNGVVLQIMIMLAAPLLGYMLGTIVSYYILYAILAVVSFILPYLMVVGMVTVGIWYFLNIYRTLGMPTDADDKDDSTDDKPAPKSTILKILDIVGKFCNAYSMELKSALIALAALFCAATIVVDGFDIKLRSQQQATESFDFTIMYGGVGTLKLGAEFYDSPSGSAGFYNDIRTERVEGSTDENPEYIYSLYLDDELVASFQSSPAKNCMVDSYKVHSSRISLPNGVHPGMPLRKALKDDSVKAKATYNGKGYTISVTSNTYDLISPEAAAKALVKEAHIKCSFLDQFNTSIELTGSDFTKDAVVEFIHIR